MTFKPRNPSSVQKFTDRFSRSDNSDPRINWEGWLRLIERQRRLLAKLQLPRNRSMPSAYFAAATFSSFRLEGIKVDEFEVSGALQRGSAIKGIRARLVQRIRNHVAILQSIQRNVRLGEALKGQTVVRWYTSISSGLSTAGLDDRTLTRLDEIVRWINSPQLRLQPAVTEIARLHVRLLEDPFVPSFNGILSRLLLQFHLGRCGLLPVVFDPEIERAYSSSGENQFLRRLMSALDASYNLILKV